MRTGGTYNGTGAALYFCIGFVPDFVSLWDLETATLQNTLEWNRAMRSAECADGFLRVFTIAAGNVTNTRLTATQGVAPYFGGDVLTSTTQSSVAYGDGVYLWRDPIGDYKANLTYGPASVPITTWTLGSAANRTGSVNDVSVAAPRVGEGSRITIRETATGIVKSAIVEAWAAGYGSAANAITLSLPIKSGTVERITGMYDFIPIPVGKTTSAGFYMAHVTLSVDTILSAFQAGTYSEETV